LFLIWFRFDVSTVTLERADGGTENYLNVLHTDITASLLRGSKNGGVNYPTENLTDSPYNKTSDVFSPEYKANTSRRIGFSADVITNTSSKIRLYTAFAMHMVGICPNIT